MRPTSGGTVVLTLESAGGAAVRYRAELLRPDADWQAMADVALADGRVTFGAWAPPDPPAWMVALAQAFLRAEWRKRRDPDAPPWPRTLRRWRESR